MSSPSRWAGQNPTTAFGREPLLGDDPVEHPLGVVEQRACGLAEHGVLEDRRVAAAQTPHVEERRPVDVRRRARRHRCGRTCARP